MPKKRKMTAEEFEIVRRRLQRRIGERRLEAARLALVEGMRLQTISDRFEWKSRQAINDVIGVACDELVAYREMVKRHQRV